MNTDGTGFHTLIWVQLLARVLERARRRDTGNRRHSCTSETCRTAPLDAGSADDDAVAGTHAPAQHWMMCTPGR